jgi:hypothetical protein
MTLAMTAGYRVFICDDMAMQAASGRWPPNTNPLQRLSLCCSSQFHARVVLWNPEM